MIFDIVSFVGEMPVSKAGEILSVGIKGAEATETTGVRRVFFPVTTAWAAGGISVGEGAKGD